METSRRPPALPPVLDTIEYRRSNPDLAEMDEDQLVTHYTTFGEAEGRRANEIWARECLSRLVDIQGPILEIGPFNAPLFRGPSIAYADIIDAPALRERALGHGLDPDGVPEIDWVVAPNDLSTIENKFEAVMSSHVVEHQPDLVNHLSQVERLLVEGGRYVVAVPDHRYCFDHFMEPSTIADVIGAWLDSRSSHTSRSILEHRALVTHNDPVRHWEHDHGDPYQDRLARLGSAIQEISEMDGGHVDVHAWYFTPASWTQILEQINQLGLCGLRVERTYPTVRYSNEFYSVLTLE